MPAVLAFLLPQLFLLSVALTGHGPPGHPHKAHHPTGAGCPVTVLMRLALQALGPRSIPSKAAIEAELEKLRVEAGGEADSDDEENGGPGSCQTALAKDPPDYFGFVG